MTTLLVDGDALVFRVAAAANKEIDWGDGVVTRHTDKEAAKARITEHVEGFMEKLEAETAVMAFSDSENFRKKIFPAYKSNRTDEKPIAYRDLVAWAKETWPSYQRPSLEGDDVLGILATGNKIVKGRKIVVADDKDMLGVPCNLYRPWAGDDDTRSVVAISEADADRWHLFQTLTGDATDGYGGCPGCGPVKAEKILDVRETMPEGADAHMYQVRRMWRAVVEAYAKAEMTVEYALAMARCARILRRSDYDLKKKGPILWTPPSP